MYISLLDSDILNISIMFFLWLTIDKKNWIFNTFITTTYMSFEVTLVLNCNFFVNPRFYDGIMWLIFFIRIRSWLCLWIVHCLLSLLFSLTCITKNATDDTRLEQTKWVYHAFTTLSGNVLYFSSESIFWSIRISCRNNKRGQIYVSEPRCSRYLSN